jgi:hypothetical protein
MAAHKFYVPGARGNINDALREGQDKFLCTLVQYVFNLHYNANSRSVPGPELLTQLMEFAKQHFTPESGMHAALDDFTNSVHNDVAERIKDHQRQPKQQLDGSSCGRPNRAAQQGITKPELALHSLYLLHCFIVNRGKEKNGEPATYPQRDHVVSEDDDNLLTCTPTQVMCAQP